MLIDLKIAVNTLIFYDTTCVQIQDIKMTFWCFKDVMGL